MKAVCCRADSDTSTLRLAHHRLACAWNVAQDALSFGTPGDIASVKHSLGQESDEGIGEFPDRRTATPPDDALRNILDEAFHPIGPGRKTSV